MAPRNAALAFAVLCGVAIAANVPACNAAGPDELEGKGLGGVLNDHDPIIVKFYAPWCGHCKAMAPAWEALPAELTKRGLKTTAWSVDATVAEEAARHFSVQGFPTVVMAKGDKLYEFSGARSTANLADFVESHEKGEGEGEGDAKAFDRAATAAVLMVDAPAKPAPGAYQPRRDTSLPSDVVELTDETFEHLTQATTGSTTGPWMVKFYAPWCGHCKALAPLWEDLATEYKGRVNFAKVDATKEHRLAEAYNVSAFPKLAFVRDGLAYPCNHARDFDVLGKYMMGEYKDYAKEAVPAPVIPSMMSVHLHWIVKDWQTLYANKKNVLATAVGGGFAAGVFMGWLLTKLCCSGTRAAAPAAGGAKAHSD